MTKVPRTEKTKRDDTDDSFISQQGLKVLVYQRVFRGLWCGVTPNTVPVWHQLVFHVHPLDGGEGPESHPQMSKVVFLFLCWPRFLMSLHKNNNTSVIFSPFRLPYVEDLEYFASVCLIVLHRACTKDKNVKRRQARIWLCSCIGLTYLACLVETGGRLASTETISDSERQAGSKFSVCRSASSDVQLKRPHPQTSPNNFCIFAARGFLVRNSYCSCLCVCVPVLRSFSPVLDTAPQIFRQHVAQCLVMF